ncbi:hypothetical protein FB45DRAFT_1013615 [Roridomyces roridus]|uniref:Uncharacterized protein n=1 Tax=Roridomyces roridus TaxID=1738132 RepID=A0AAD7AYJ7_9AGAR|nr:hypothetical protein FB45DRAFT_1013615 [Roridomyces roridus]
MSMNGRIAGKEKPIAGEATAIKCSGAQTSLMSRGSETVDIGTRLTDSEGCNPKLDSLNLDLLPNLTQIDAYQISEPFNRFLARLPRNNRIETINVLSMSLVSTESFESAVLERSMPALKRVNAQVSGSILSLAAWSRPPPWEETVRRIEATFPRITESGLLRVVYVSPERLLPSTTMSSPLFPQETWDEIVDHIAGHFDEKMHMAELNRLLWPVAIPWSNVLQLTLGSMEAAAGSTILQNVAKLVGLASLRGLVFRIGRWDPTHLCNIFASCTSVKRLIFVQCWPPPLTAPFVQSAVTFARPEFITFSASDPIIDLILEPTCPFDLSRLTRLKFVDLDNPRINNLLGRVGRTLTQLHLHGHDQNLDNLNLELLPSLTQIDVFQISEHFNRLLARLPTTNCIETINVLPMGLTSYEAALESALLGRSMPALKRVNVQVSGGIPGMEAWSRSPPWEETVRGIEDAFPRLYERGLLRVVFVPFPGSTIFW